MTDSFGQTTTDMSVCTIVVSYEPDVDQLSRLCRELEKQSQYLIVDNGSDPRLVAGIEDCLTAHGHLLSMAGNRGIAAAQNAGVDYAAKKLAAKPRYFLFLDQDSMPGDNLVASLRRNYELVKKVDPRAAAIGPALLDVRSQQLLSLHQELLGFYIKRRIKPGQKGKQYKVASINSSGTFLDASALEKIGPFLESLFIDHVDTEWSHRARHLGYSLYVSTGVVLDHEMGRGLEKIWILGNQHFPSRAPLRHYYLFRNNVYLLSEPQMSRTWKLWSVLKLSFTFCYFGLVPQDRRDQRTMMLEGIAAGRKGELGSRKPRR